MAVDWSEDYEWVRDQWKKSQALADRRLALLKRLEWSVVDDYSSKPSCPMCGGWKGKRYGHDTDCELARELANAKS